MMKKLFKTAVVCGVLCLAVLLACCGNIFSVFALTAKAATPAEAFEFHAEKCKITGLTEYGKALTEIDIPSEIDGVPVLSIGTRAFQNCTSLTSVTIPNSVTEIGQFAFYGCASLTSITIPDSVTTIGDYAFDYCTSLTSVAIGNSVTLIGYSAFANCTSLTSVTIPGSVTEIGGWAFDGCTSLTSVTIGNSVTKISQSAFANCTSLTSVTIGNSVTTIGVSAFQNCTSLTSVTIGSSVETIGAEAFENCTSLTSVTIPNSVTTIGGSAFENCTSLTSVTIPDSVTSIGGGTFSGCICLEKIYIPKNAAIRYDYYNYISPVVDLLNGCTSLTDVYYSGTEEEWKNIAKGLNTRVKIHFNSSELGFRVEFEGYEEPDEPEISESPVGQEESETIAVPDEPGKNADAHRTDKGDGESADDGGVDKGIVIIVVAICFAVVAVCAVMVALIVRKMRYGGTK